MFMELLDGRILNIVYIQDLLLDKCFVIYIQTNGGRIKECCKSISDAQARYSDVRALLLKSWSGGGGSGSGSDGREIELRKSVTHVQWRYVGDSMWRDLITLTELTGPAGESPAFRVNKGVLQYRYLVAIPNVWTDLYTFPEANKISELSSITVIDSADVIMIEDVSAGTNKKVTVGELSIKLKEEIIDEISDDLVETVMDELADSFEIETYSGEYSIVNNTVNLEIKDIEL